MSSKLVAYETGEIIEAVDTQEYGIARRDTVEAIARNMIEFSRGKVAGGYLRATEADIKLLQDRGQQDQLRKTYDEAGNEVIMRPARKVGTTWETGDLLYQDATWLVQKTLSRGLNPTSDISYWYINGRLIDHINYQTVKGFAEVQGKSSPEYFVMTPDDRTRHGLNKDDIGIICYLVLDADKQLYLQSVIQLAAQVGNLETAKHQVLDMIAKGKGIGIVRADEKNKQIPIGRSKEWVAQKRALTDACNQGFGRPTTSQVIEMQNGRINEADLQALAAPDYPMDLPPDRQQFYLEANRVTEQVKVTPEDELRQAVKRNIALMRGPDPDEDDPTAELPEESEADVAPETPDELAELRNAIAKEAAENPRKGKATEKQLAIIGDKLEECFAGDDDSAQKGAVVANWLFDSAPMTFGQAQALGHRLLKGQDEETGDYPLNQEFIHLAQGIYRQAQIEAG